MVWFQKTGPFIRRSVTYKQYSCRSIAIAYHNQDDLPQQKSMHMFSD